MAVEQPSHASQDPVVLHVAVSAHLVWMSAADSAAMSTLAYVDQI